MVAEETCIPGPVYTKVRLQPHPGSSAVGLETGVCIVAYCKELSRPFLKELSERSKLPKSAAFAA